MCLLRLTWIVGCMFQPFWPILPLSDILQKGWSENPCRDSCDIDAAWQFTLYHLQDWKRIQHPLANQKLHRLLHPNSRLPVHTSHVVSLRPNALWKQKFNQPWQDKFKAHGVLKFAPSPRKSPLAISRVALATRLPKGMLRGFSSCPDLLQI